MKYFTIPVFVPELACPNRCVFCNQNSISGCYHQPDVNEVIGIIESRLKTLPVILFPEINRNQVSAKNSQQQSEHLITPIRLQPVEMKPPALVKEFEASKASQSTNVHIEVGFFGGNFTGIDEELQRKYLCIAFNYLKDGKINGIRLSTRPDYITSDSLKLLKEYGVSTIELGAQSLDVKVLSFAGRGHTVADIEKASALIISYGFKLGLQMMTGLPGDSFENSVATARKIIDLGASCTRIYPTLVIKNTELAKLWQEGNYCPQTLEEAVELTATLLEIFKEGGVDVIRVGLHPSEDLVRGDDLLAGPFHVSFRQLAETELWKRRFSKLIDTKPQESEIVISVPEVEFNNAIGYNASNRTMLEAHFKSVEFKKEQLDSNIRPLILADKRLPLPAKNALMQSFRLTLLPSDPGVYKSISGHPDIFMCMSNDSIVVSPGLDQLIVERIANQGYRIVKGFNLPGKTYPASACYNAIVTDNYLIHNSKITDQAIIETFKLKMQIHVNQGYTRCNLLPLNNETFITSDRGIEKVLLNEGLQVLFVDPSPVVLKGQKHGFFPGCCGTLGNQVLIAGSLKYHPQQEEIVSFIASLGMSVKELFDGKLMDVGSIFSFPHL